MSKSSIDKIQNTAKRIQAIQGKYTYKMPRSIRNVLKLSEQLEATMKGNENLTRIASQIQAVQDKYNNKLFPNIELAIRASELMSINMQPFVENILRVQDKIKPVLEMSKFKFQINPVVTTAINRAQELASVLELIDPLTISEAYSTALELSAEPNESEIALNDIEEKITNTPVSLISIEYLGILLTLIIFYFQYQNSAESDSILMERLENMQTSIEAQIDELKGEENKYSFYVVSRAVNLRTKPTTKSDVVQILYPNHKIKLIERRSKWIKIEFFDYASNELKEGWVFKKYLKIINPKKPTLYIKQ